MISSAGGWKVEVIVPLRGSECFEQAFEPFCLAVTAFEVEEGRLWRVEGFAMEAPPAEELTAAVAIAAMRAGIAEPGVTCMPLPATDWVAETQRSFQPLRAGRYFIRPSHFDGPVPKGAKTITVDAGAAFGTGEHATTKGCLLALDGLARSRRFTRPLDLGCGSGILAMATAMTWHCPVLAADIDPAAVTVSRENAGINQLSSRMRIICSDGFAAPELRRAAPYDLIIANILARPLVALSHPIRRYLAPGGVCVLSGLLAVQEREVAAAFRRQGMKMLRRIGIDGWNTLIVAR
jgi:ribosomal protein L11 methyltransferase